MTNEELQSKIEEILADVNENQSDTILGMVKPRFVACDAAEQTITLAYPGQAWERNPLGIMQGGVVATVMDYSVACMILAFGGEKPVTVSLQVSYLRGTPVSGTLNVRVRATKMGRTVVHAFAECYEAQSPDKLVATANVAYMLP